jgi:hypothetical protein
MALTKGLSNALQKRNYPLRNWPWWKKGAVVAVAPIAAMLYLFTILLFGIFPKLPNKLNHLWNSFKRPD